MLKMPKIFTYQELVHQRQRHAKLFLSEWNTDRCNAPGVNLSENRKQS